jgi:hypothetical protein
MAAMTRPRPDTAGRPPAASTRSPAPTTTDTLRALASDDSTTDSPTTPAASAADLAQLRARLTIPVPGVRAADLPDTFNEMRGTRRHDALDIPAPRGTPVLSASDGRLLRLFTSVNGGLMIYAADATDRFILMYAHLDRYAAGLTDGMPLRRGQVIGYVGTTGNAPPNLPHLHFAIARAGNIRQWWRGTPVDPRPLLAPDPAAVQRLPGPAGAVAPCCAATVTPVTQAWAHDPRSGPRVTPRTPPPSLRHMLRMSEKTTWVGHAGKFVAAGTSTGAALVTIMSFLYSYGVIGNADGHKTIGHFGAAWLGLRPTADTAEAIGDTLHLAATVTDRSGSVLIGVQPAWSSENSTIASVRSDGSVIARSPGSTTIVAVVGGLTARSRIIVRQRVASLRIAGDSGITIAEGDRQLLHVQPSDARGHSIASRPTLWRADDTSVVTLDSLGTLIARNPGRTIVSATTDGVAAQAVVTVISTPTSVAVVAGSTQRAAAGMPLPQPVAVRVTDRRGHPVEGTMVRFRTADGQGSIEPTAALTNHDGRAHTLWTLGELPGRQTLLARVDRIDSAVAVAAEADPVPANTRVAALADSPHGTATATLTDPVGVRLTDSTGRVLRDVPITWLALDGGRVTALSPRTDSLGEAHARWTLGPKAGRQRLHALVGSGRGMPPLTIVGLANAGQPASVTVVSGARQHATAGELLLKPIIVRVADDTGNPVTSAALTLAPSTGSVPTASLRTDSLGLAAIRWKMGRAAGEQTLLVRADHVSEPLRLTLRAAPAEPASISFEHSRTRDATTHQRAQAIVALVTDAYGNPVGDATVSFAAREGTVAPARATTDGRGRVTLRWTPAPRTGEQTLTGAVHGTSVRGAIAVQVAAPTPAPHAKAGRKGRAPSATSGRGIWSGTR